MIKKKKKKKLVNAHAWQLSVKQVMVDWFENYT